MRKSGTKLNVLVYLTLIVVFWLAIEGTYLIFYNDDSLEFSHLKTYKKGFIICSGDDIQMLRGTEILIHDIRHTWKSSIPIAVYHCDEIVPETQSYFHAKYDNLHFIDICIRSTLKKKKRFRTWFCKTAALISSIFDETVILDIDSVWFQNPLQLFNWDGYKDTGALYFRDRFMYENSTDQRALFYQDVTAYITTMNPHITFNRTQLHQFNKGYGYQSYYWLHGLYPDSIPALRHVQESSVIVFYKHKMKKVIEVLKHIIYDFHLGYGDKEIYWIASTIAQVPFAWEPYIFGSYGNCGEIIHFNQKGEPLYINAAYLTQDVYIGKNIQLEITKPIKATSDLKLFELGEYNPTTGGRCGACTYMECVPTPSAVNARILEIQKLHMEYSEINIPTGSIYHKIYMKIERFLIKLLIS